MSQWAITAYGLHKSYKRAAEGAGLNGFELEVGQGTIRALLGPNGAGKTTAVRILTTLLAPDRGEASVAGFDVCSEARHVREHIGLVGQYAAIDELLSGRDNLVLFGRLNRLSARQARQRADELLEQFDLMKAAATPASKYSGGMRRRLDLATSLIVSPSVLFVDEPTTGLDPAARQEVWEAIRSLADNGATVLLTTQYLEEADRLAHTVSLMKEGRVIAEGSPEQLKAACGGDRIEITLGEGRIAEQAARVLQDIASAEVAVNPEIGRISVPVADRTAALIAVISSFRQAGIEPQDIALRRPTLDEAFLYLTRGDDSAPHEEDI